MALLVGVLGPYMAGRATRATLEHQRTLAREERLWHQRSDTYVALLEWAGMVRKVNTHVSPAQMRDAAGQLRIPLDLDARLTAHASYAVYGAAREFLGGIVASDLASADLLLAAQAKAPPADMERLEAELVLAASESDRSANNMARLISDDLHGVLPWDAGRRAE